MQRLGGRGKTALLCLLPLPWGPSQFGGLAGTSSTAGTGGVSAWSLPGSARDGAARALQAQRVCSQVLNYNSPSPRVLLGQNHG